MKTILLALVQLAGMQVVIALAGILRNKILASNLGTEGFGAFSHMYVLVLTIYATGKFGMAVGLSRAVARAKDHAARQELLDAANFLVIGLSVLIWLFGSQFFAASLQSTLGNAYSPGIAAAFLLLLLALPIDALQSNYLGFLQGELDISGIASRRSLGVILATMIGIPAVWYLGVIGAAIQMTLLSLATAWLLGRQCSGRGYRPLNLWWHGGAARVLLAVGSASLLSGFAQNFSDIAVRTALILRVNPAQNGLYQAALSIIGQVTAVLLGSIGSLSLASVARHEEPEAVSRASNQLLRVTNRAGALGLGIVGLLSYPLLRVLFTAEFASASHIFAPLLLADYIRSFVWVIGAPLLARGFVSIWLASDLLLAGVRWGVTILLLPRLGLPAVAVGYVSAWTVHLIVNLWLYRVKLRLRLDRTAVRTFLAGSAFVYAMGWLGARQMYSVGLVILGLYLGLSVRRAEWDSLVRTVMARRRAG